MTRFFALFYPNGVLLRRVQAPVHLGSRDYPEPNKVQQPLPRRGGRTRTDNDEDRQSASLDLGDEVAVHKRQVPAELLDRAAISHDRATEETSTQVVGQESPLLPLLGRLLIWPSPGVIWLLIWPSPGVSWQPRLLS